MTCYFSIYNCKIERSNETPTDCKLITGLHKIQFNLKCTMMSLKMKTVKIVKYKPLLGSYVNNLTSEGFIEKRSFKIFI